MYFQPFCEATNITANICSGEDAQHFNLKDLECKVEHEGGNYKIPKPDSTIPHSMQKKTTPKQTNKQTQTKEKKQLFYVAHLAKYGKSSSLCAVSETKMAMDCTPRSPKQLEEL